MPKHKHSEVIKPDAFSFANLELVMEDGELISAKVL